MLGLGIIMILLAILFQFAGVNALFQGLKIGFLVFGLFSVISGYAYRKTEQNLLANQTKLYQENPTQFHEIEKERMEKVVKNFPLIQWVFFALIVTSLVVVFLYKNSLVDGILFSLIVLLIGNTIIETVSKTSIDRYYEQLSYSQSNDRYH